MTLENLLKKIKKGKRFIKRSLIAGLISSSLLFSCNVNPPSPKPKPQKNELSENTQVLSEQDTLKITALYDDGIILSEPISYLSPGDIIVSGISDMVPNGLLRRINYVSGDGTTIYTEQATLEEALKDADFEFQGTLSPRNVKSFTAKKGVLDVSNHKSLFDFNINLDNVILYDFDEDPFTTNDQIIANGNISFNSDFYLKFKIKDFGLKQLIFKNISTEDSQLEISASNNLKNFEKEILLKRYYFHPFIAGYLPTAPPFPIIITPILDVNAGMNGSISNIKTSVTQEANLTAGLKYEKEGGWSPIFDFSNSFSWIPPSPSETSSFKAYAGPRLNFSLYGIAGPYGEINGYLKLDAEQSPWKLYGGLEANLGVKMQIFSKTILDYFANVLKSEKLLAEGQSSEPPQPPLETTTVAIQPGPEGKDMFIRKDFWSDGTITVTSYDTTYLNVDSFSGMVKEDSLIQFPLSSLPNNVNITSAKLRLYGQGAFLLETAKVEIYKITSPWEESEWNYSNTDISPSYGEYITSSTLTDEVKWHEWDITSLVQEWMNGEANYGLVLRTNYSRPTEEYGFKSSDYSDPTKRPMLVISYY